MITCKEDLVNTYIENDNGVLRDVYVSLCNLHGVNIISKLAIESESIIEVTLDSCGECSAFTPSRHNLDNDCKQLTLTDLLPTSYENTKVYSLDEDVIRKYAELCGVEYNHRHTDDEEVGICKVNNQGFVDTFIVGSVVDIRVECTTLTTEQILAAWDLKFGEVKTRTESEYQAVVKECEKAIKSLVGHGFSDNGGELWKPPVNEENGRLIKKVISLEDEIESLKQDKQTLRTKVEYVKCISSLSVIAKAMIDGEIFYDKDGLNSYAWSGYRFEVNNGGAIEVRGDFYRRTEVEIDWKECVGRVHGDMHYDDNLVGVTPMPVKEFVEMCHLVESLTEKPQ